jgi:hypothetical protein
MYVDKAIPLSMQRLKITAMRLDFLQCITDIKYHIYLFIFNIKSFLSI